MLISLSRTEDQHARFLMLEAMETCLRIANKNNVPNTRADMTQFKGEVSEEFAKFLQETALSIGESSAAMKKKIETKDYSREDKLLQLIQH